MKLLSFFFKENPPTILKFIARQAKKPSGLFGKYVAGKAFNKGNKALHDFGLSLMNISPYEKILEIGFGNGLQLYEMAHKEKSARFFGVDYSKDMVAQASKLNSTFIANNMMELHEASVEKMPFKDNNFDKIYTANTVYFWPNHDENIKEVLRILKPGGKLFIGFRIREQMEKIPFTRYGFTFFTEKAMFGFLKKAGFSNIEIQQREDKPFTSYIAIGTK